MPLNYDLPQVLPLFPLPKALLLPRGHLPLQVFEPRYLTLLEDTLKTPDRLIGMVQPFGEGLHKIGCAGRVTQFAESEDGRYMITLTGVSRFALGNIQDGVPPYQRTTVAWDAFRDDLNGPNQDPNFDRDVFLKLLNRYFDEQNLTTDWESVKEAGDEALINALSMVCPFEGEDKQALLEAPDLPARRQILTALIEFSVHGGNDEGRLQ